MVLKLFLHHRENISPCDPERSDQPERSVDQIMTNRNMNITIMRKYSFF